MGIIICKTYWLFYTVGWNHLHLYICWVNLCADGQIHLHLNMFGFEWYADGCGHALVYICFVNIYADG